MVDQKNAFEAKIRLYSQTTLGDAALHMTKARMELHREIEEHEHLGSQRSIRADVV